MESRQLCVPAVLSTADGLLLGCPEASDHTEPLSFLTDAGQRHRGRRARWEPPQPCVSDHTLCFVL